MSDFHTYLQVHEEEHLQQLKEWLRIPSISTLPDHADQVRSAAQWLVDHARTIGLEHVQLLETPGHPTVYADWLHAEGQPTVLIYGHYDVQPVDPLYLWTTPPFEPTIRDGRLYARGASDDKGQVFMHLKALEALFQTVGALPVNIRLLIEGEEEVGSRNLPDLLRTHTDMLKSDVIVISDTPILGPGQPSVCYGLRGLAALQVDIKGPKGDLHSGLYGGAVQNPIHALVELLSTLHDKEGHILVDGFYEDVVLLTEAERTAYKALHFDEEQMRRELDVPSLFGEPGYTALERTWARPTLEINGIYGGFEGEGTKTVIPSEAHAKITCRLVPDQNPEAISKQIESHLQKHAPTGVSVSVQIHSGGRPYVTPFDHPAIQLAAKAYESAYGVPAAFTRMGGSIPIVEAFDQILKTPVVLIGFGLNTENFHAPNEHFHLENYHHGLRVLCQYWLDLPSALATGSPEN